MSTNTQDLIRRIGHQTIKIEAQTLNELVSSINEDFVRCVEAVFASKGRLVVSGIGKTAIIAQKVVATLNSTGTPSLYMHAADAIHGDIGMVQADDKVLLLSKSGETAEIKLLAALVAKNNNELIAMVSRSDCSIAKQADYVLLTPVSQEADPNLLAPTASTTAQMAMGDALALALMALRGFSSDDFAQYHPGGTLGKQLYLRVCDIYPLHERPEVGPETDLQSTILEMTSKRLGATGVVDPNTGDLLGIITDGDLRRMLPGRQNLTTIRAENIMSTSPKSVLEDTLAVNALAMMRKHSISQLVVINQEGRYLGLIHLHDLLREGLI